MPRVLDATYERMAFEKCKEDARGVLWVQIATAFEQGLRAGVGRVVSVPETHGEPVKVGDDLALYLTEDLVLWVVGNDRRCVRTEVLFGVYDHSTIQVCGAPTIVTRLHRASFENGGRA